MPGLVVDAGVEVHVAVDQLLRRGHAAVLGDAAVAPPVVRHGAAAVGDDDPQRREVGEQPGREQLGECRGVGGEVVRRRGVEVRVARCADVDHHRDVELDGRLVERIPVAVEQRGTGPVATARIGIEIAADEPELLHAAPQLAHRRFDRRVRRLRELAHRARSSVDRDRRPGGSARCSARSSAPRRRCWRCGAPSSWLAARTG